MDANKLGMFLELLKKKKKLKESLNNTQEMIKEQINSLGQEELERFYYDSLKEVYESEKYFMEDTTKELFEDILNTKRLEKFPQLAKPTYYPEIDALNIPDEEKLRIDKAARENVKYYMSEDAIKWNEFGMSLRDLEMLVSIGVAQKRYSFYCPYCGSRCSSVPDDEMQLHKRIWELEKIQEMSEEQIEEFDKLQYDYGCIYIDCMDCDCSFEITNEKEFEEFQKHIKGGYKIVKKPDLSYEKL